MRRHLLWLVLTLVFLPLYSAATLAGDEGDRWARTLERISPGVVQIRVDAPRPFDTEWENTTEATGFVVDAERGLILTNRHVVFPGPVVAEAVFQNSEEVELTPVYRDPVHDFGFFRYDPDELNYIQPVEIPLSPERAVLGREIRVVGNDAGERLSILAGTIARLDREAPDYGRGRYNDFNTFYIQAASGTSGGSSGAPVIDADGHALALNAGARIDAKSSYFLPLDRVVRARDRILNGEEVTRGTLQTTFVRQSFDELRRLGLPDDLEQAARLEFPDQTGMLVVDLVVPEGPAYEALETGDILIRVNGRMVTRFTPLAEVLDESVGESVQLEIVRGGDRKQVELTVDDLKGITPTRYIEAGGGVLNPLSYQQARHFNRPPGGVYLAYGGYMFGRSGIPRGSMIRSIAGEEVNSLDEFRRVFEGLPDGDRVPIRYTRIDEPRREVLATLTVDRTWFPARECEMNPESGYWPCEDFAGAGRKQSLGAGNVRFGDYSDEREHRLARSLVWVEFDAPFRVEGLNRSSFQGTGLVVDAAEGLVLTDRATAASQLGDLRLTFAGSLELEGEVKFLDPLNNLALISYDPSMLVGSEVRSAEFNTARPLSGDDVWIIGHREDQSLVSRRTEMEGFEPLRLPLSNGFGFRDVNLETFAVSNPPSNVGGVSVDQSGRVLGFWANYKEQAREGNSHRGIPADVIQNRLTYYRERDSIRSLEVELLEMPLSSARRLGLSEEWASRMANLDDLRRSVLQVERIVAGSPAEDVLKSGDLVLAVDGEPVNDFRRLNEASQSDTVALKIFRDGEIKELEVETVALDGRGIDRVITWAGAVLHEPHRAMAAQRGVPREGVYISDFHYGSPASRYGLNPGRRIIAVDGEDIENMDEFLDAVSGRSDRDPVRVRIEDWDGTRKMVTLKLDLRYWPTTEVRRDNGQWVREEH